MGEPSWNKVDKTSWNQREIDKFEHDIKSNTLAELQEVYPQYWPPDDATELLKASRINAEILSRGFSHSECDALLA